MHVRQRITAVFVPDEDIINILLESRLVKKCPRDCFKLPSHIVRRKNRHSGNSDTRDERLFPLIQKKIQPDRCTVHRKAALNRIDSRKKESFAPVLLHQRLNGSAYPLLREFNPAGKRKELQQLPLRKVVIPVKSDRRDFRLGKKSTRKEHHRDTYSEQLSATHDWRYGGVRSNYGNAIY